MFEHPPDLSSDIEWMLQSGQVSLDVLAETLVDAWYPLIYQFAFSILGNEEEARQVVIDTLVTALLDTHHYTNETGIQKWLLQYAIQDITSKNKQEKKGDTNSSLRRWLQDRQKKNPAISSLNQTEPEKEEIKIAWQVLASSPLEDRLPALLFFQFNYRIEEIAGILKCEVHTVHFRLQKSRSRLRRELEASGLHNVALKTGYLERLLRETCQQQLFKMQAQTHQRRLVQLEIIRLVNRKQSIRRTHISVQEFATISLVVLVIVSISWGFSFLLPVPAPPPALQSPQDPAVVQPVMTVKPAPYRAQDQENNKFPLESVLHYIVQPGDTLETVSTRLAISPLYLRTANNLPQDGTLLAGQILVLHTNPTSLSMPSPVMVPNRPHKVLNAQSPPSLILQRIQEHDLFYQSLWADGRVIFYGPAGYSGPPRSYRVQLWSKPGSALVVAGSLAGNPEGVLLTVDLPGSSPGKPYLAFRSGDNGQWFFSDEQILSRKSSLDRLAYPIEALDMVQRMVHYQPQNTLFAAVRVENISGRSVLVTDIVSQDDEKRGRLWIDQNNGVILRWQHFTGLQENIVDWEVTLSNVIFDTGIHPYFFKSYYYLPENYAEDQHGLPELQTIDEAISLRSLPFTHPELSFPVAPKSFDPGKQWLVFQYPNSFDYLASSSEVEIFSNEYYLGSLPFGNPWTLICSRSPDGYQIAYVAMPDNTTQETFLNWFDLRESELKVHNVLGGIAIKEMAFSPDSRYLAAFGSNSNSSGIYLVDMQSQRIRQLRQLTNARSLVWSPDSTSLAMIVRTEADEGIEMLLVINVEEEQIVFRGLWDSRDIKSLDESPVKDWDIPFPVQPQGLEGCARPPAGNE